MSTQVYFCIPFRVYNKKLGIKTFENFPLLSTGLLRKNDIFRDVDLTFKWRDMRYILRISSRLRASKINCFSSFLQQEMRFDTIFR